MEVERIIPIDKEYEAREDDSASGESRYTLYSATTNYRFENGRTYHAYREGEYWGPNDLKMLNHENIVHHLCLLTLRDRFFLAPIKNPRRILDIGTGKGLWATDVADRFPEAKVIGVDFSSPPSGPQPDNLEFLIDDATSEWAYDANFDFVHIRGLFGSIGDWPSLYAQIFEHLYPGGYFEQMEWSVYMKSDDGTLSADSELAKWGPRAVALTEKNGKTAEIAERMAGLIREAGFVDVVEKRYKWPIGSWSSDPTSKKIGHWNIKNWDEGIEGWVMKLYTMHGGYSVQDVRDMCQRVRKALKHRRQHVYHEVRLVYARKPEL